MASGLIIDYLGFGAIADRPVTPSLHTGALGLYWATDEDILYVWDGAWASSTTAVSFSLGGLTNVTETTPSEGEVLSYDGAGWVNGPVPAPAPPAVVTEATTARTATPGNAGEYTRFTHADAKTYTFTDAETYVQGAEYFGRNVGAGDLTLTAVGTITLNAPAGGTLVVPQGGSFSVKMASATEGDVIGYTEAAA